MRVIIAFGFCLLATGCMRKVDLGSLGPITRAEILYHPSWGNAPWPLKGDEVPTVASFIEGQRSAWTRAFAVGFGMPSPFCYVHLYNGDYYLGYFAVGAGILPGSAAFFEMHYGDVYARKRVTRAEANRFLDVIGQGGDLR